jgi:hypothetical protein
MMSQAQRQLLLILFGIVAWFVAAMFIRLALPQGWLDGGAATIGIFLVSLPVAAVSIEAAHRIMRGEAGRLTRTAVVISYVGLLLDGLAFVWASNLYTADRAALGFGGAWLLWTVGATLVYASIRDARSQDPA